MDEGRFSVSAQFRAAPLFCRPWTLNGITPRLIESHYEGNYGSALRRLNAITRELEDLDPATAPPGAINRLKRDEAIALNSTLLHELYFACLGGDGRTVPEPLATALARDFGSVDRWRKEFVALANGLAGGSGWVLLIWVPRDGRLINQIGADHSQNTAGAVWRDPERLDDWIDELSKEKPVVTYCVYGFHVGCQTAIALRKAGFDARYMAGGHYGWKALGGKVRLFDADSPDHGERRDQGQ